MIRAPVSDEQIGVAVVIEITRADALRPSPKTSDPRFGHIAEVARRPSL